MKCAAEVFSAFLSTPSDSFSPEAAMELLAAAEGLLREDISDCPDTGAWHQYLNRTGHHSFLQLLPSRECRYRWADTAFQAILRSGYSLETMLADRVRRHPDHVFFRESSDSAQTAWTYAEIGRRLRNLAGLFCRLEAEPRVAIYCENSIDSACCDLACLVHRIFDTPLNVHSDAPALVWISDRLGMNIVIADTEERIQRLQEVRSRTSRPFRILVAGPRAGLPHYIDCEFLQEACARLDLDSLEHLLGRRQNSPLTDVATVMFTSGSTGAPKGIAFTHYHLITKRFSRAAALPGVGEHEVLLCYLPLFHTFGRYLEMLGTLYWGGTYVFAGNPSLETLISQLQQVHPTGLVGIPLRWAQIRDNWLENARDAGSPQDREAVFRSIVGNRLRWGLSAAGYLDPKVFHLFQQYGVDLCSGFGMTEATGGVTMTPAGEYVDGTVGIPLPGIRTRFAAQGELEIAGPYVARYIDEKGGGEIPPQDPHEDYWLATGDLFKIQANGYLEIVDRVKDIYKNNRGQTIAPRRVEQKFDGVPGIKGVFLVGDGRDSNVLLIVPDREDKVLQATENSVQEYFHQIVAAANADLAPYERVVNFALVDREFALERDELTPKGSYRRKAIEKNFAAVIEKLYQGNYVEHVCGEIHVRIPRWFFRDLGLLETDIHATPAGLYCASTQRSLSICVRGDSKTVLIGDLEYQLSGSVVDLGLFARQPKLWMGNPALAAFCPCKDGWDLPMPSVSGRVWLPWRNSQHVPAIVIEHTPVVRGNRLRHIHHLCMEALFLPEDSALEALGMLGKELRASDDRLAGVIRGRLEALARHPVEEIRCLAYRILLTDEPQPDHNRIFPAFVESGMAFLNEDSIRAIAYAGFGDKHLEALRQRLFGYRTQLQWPASLVTRDQFTKIFGLLSDFARRDSSYFGPVRAELASWALLREDPDLAKAAEARLSSNQDWFASVLAAGASDSEVAEKIVLDDSLPAHTIARLQKILYDPAFLRQSILLAFDEEGFDLRQVPPSGIWVSPVLSQHQFDLFRVGINLVNGKHFDLLLVVGDFAATQVHDTVLWLMALSQHPWHARALPRFGVCRPNLGVMSVAYINDMTVWDRIREYAGAPAANDYFPTQHDWRRLFVRGMAAFFLVWKSSGGRIIPGAVTPANVVVPDADYREGACVLSLTGWREYDGPLCLVLPLLRNFYRQTTAHYPRISHLLEISWIFDACIEALNFDDGSRFLADLESELANAQVSEVGEGLGSAVAKYRKHIQERAYMPLPLLCALDRYAAWGQANPRASPEACEEEVEQLYRLYRIDRFPPMFRYQLFRRTFFVRADAAVDAAFERLLMRLFRKPQTSAVHLVEISDLQATIVDPAQREVFSRMVFPRARGEQHLEVLTIGESEHKQVIVCSEISDRLGARFTVREPMLPAEVGRLYRLFRDADYSQKISEQDLQLVVTDAAGIVVGGLTYTVQDKEVVYLGAFVVAAPLKGRGIATALLEDFCVRMAARRVRLLKTDFFLRPYLTANGFQVDVRCGGLVRHLITH